MELLIGAGMKREKQYGAPWTKLVTLDINSDHKPDVVWDLNKRPLPFADDTFDEVHAYEVLEHLGQQGDYRTWFAEWTEWWRILKPGGVMVWTAPDISSRWAWSDPGHTRAMSPEMMTFLIQPQYDQQVGKTPMADYRFCYKADFDAVSVDIRQEDRTILCVMRAMKPSRCTRVEEAK